MRLWAITCVLLLSVPMVGSLWHAPAVSANALPMDLSDGDLMRLLAAKAGYHVAPASKTIVPPGATLPGMVQHLAGRIGETLSPTDLAPFAQLDPRVSGPTLLLLVAVDQAWTQRDAAFSKLSPAEQQELLTLTLQRNGTEPSAREQALSQEVDMEAMINAAITLDDTLEGIVMPQLQQAAQAGAWPPIAIADPGAAGTGVLRLGSPGNDVEGINRIVQIDPSGDDVYWNNAGGTTILQGALTSPGVLPIAISVDMGGNDKYSNGASAQGGGWLGIGILLDYTGNDEYRCVSTCQGGGDLGVGLMRDYMGNDTHWGMSAIGSAFNGMGIARDDSGNDLYRVMIWGGGYASDRAGPAGDLKGSIGLLWDRGGTDDYSDWTPGYAYQAYGWARGDSLGMMVDEGPEVDHYAIASAGVTPHGCNGCTWTIVDGAPGVLSHRQTGNDGEGGLAAMLAANGR